MSKEVKRITSLCWQRSVTGNRTSIVGRRASKVAEQDRPTTATFGYGGGKWQAIADESWLMSISRSLGQVFGDRRRHFLVIVI
jgi:hypothetical protein